MDTLRLLVVDDEEGMRLGVTRALSKFTVSLPDIGGEVCFDVAQAETGEEALALIEAQPPDVLLLDHKLPGISGMDVLERLGTRTNDMLTIMITAYASLETAVNAIKRGGYDFLAKPFTPAELKATVRKAAENILHTRQARRLAQEQRRLRFQFISVLAHELKAPLGAVESYLRIMQDRSAGNDQKAYDQMIDRCLVRMEGMRKLIYDLLDLTRIESGEKRREFVEVDLVEVTRQCIEDRQAEAAERAVALSLNAPEMLLMTADRGELEIIFNNLVSNAVKYNREAGRVDVTLAADEEQVTITVADTGIGMSPEECGKLFGDFVRIKNAKTRSILGSGLGLATVRKLARLYNGDAAVTSTPDVGSTFTVTLMRHIVPAQVHHETR
ncbi:MAG: response regulator [Verrucomicrobia bacterium]|nr:response regulator [Verrucomicrobiota bacterium]